MTTNTTTNRSYRTPLAVVAAAGAILTSTVAFGAGSETAAMTTFAVVRDYQSSHTEFGAGSDPVFPLEIASGDGSGFLDGAELATAQAPTALDDHNGVHSLDAQFVSVEYLADGTSRWTYRVDETGSGASLSHWAIGVDPATVVSTWADTKKPMTLVTVGKDGSTGFSGVKWDFKDTFTGGLFSVVLDDHYAAEFGTSNLVAKSGDLEDHGDIFGPSASLRSTPESWFVSQPGINISAPLAFEFALSGGNYVFDTADFTPIDGELYGNEGEDHNRLFTVEFTADFSLTNGSGDFLTLDTTADAWVLVDGTMALDLANGGKGTLDFDTLGLADGTYTLTLLVAQRDASATPLAIETSVALTGSKSYMPPTASIYD